KALLQRVSEAYGTRINEVLLAALGQSYAQWTGERSLLIDFEGHGREELFEGVDLSRTIGWFTTVFPVLLAFGDATHAKAVLKEIKEELQNIPNRGIGYGLLRYLYKDRNVAEQLQALPQAQVIFNYLGRLEKIK